MIAIVNSGGANLSSIIFALARLKVTAKLTTVGAEIKNASHVILPGVGSAHDAMQSLHKLNLGDTLRSLTQPVLGICLGMQILYEYSREGNVDCLGIISGRIEKLPIKTGITIPHMGWNAINITQQNLLLKNIENNSYFYFVHSYAAPINNATCAITTHGIEFTAVCKQNNFYGTQFHPERSGDVGSKILKNFLEL
jgi:imidazole glycerol-phosphate synthase subunit HisH